MNIFDVMKRRENLIVRDTRSTSDKIQYPLTPPRGQLHLISSNGELLFTPLKKTEYDPSNGLLDTLTRERPNLGDLISVGTNTRVLTGIVVHIDDTSFYLDVGEYNLARVEF